jgi:hypothetical protein
MYPAPHHRPPAPPPRDAAAAPRRVEPVPGTQFAVVTLDVPPVTSGLATGALVAGIASVLVSFVVVCFGVAGAPYGWGALAAGAFTLLAVVAAAGAIVLSVAARRQINQVGPAAAIRYAGKGLATSGLVTGLVGLAITLVGFGLALLLQLTGAV